MSGLKKERHSDKGNLFQVVRAPLPNDPWHAPKLCCWKRKCIIISSTLHVSNMIQLKPYAVSIINQVCPSSSTFTTQSKNQNFLFFYRRAGLRVVLGTLLLFLDSHSLSLSFSVKHSRPYTYWNLHAGKGARTNPAGRNGAPRLRPQRLSVCWLLQDFP